MNVWGMVRLGGWGLNVKVRGYSVKSGIFYRFVIINLLLGVFDNWRGLFGECWELLMLFKWWLFLLVNIVLVVVWRLFLDMLKVLVIFCLVIWRRGLFNVIDIFLFVRVFFKRFWIFFVLFLLSDCVLIIFFDEDWVCIFKVLFWFFCFK